MQVLKDGKIVFAIKKQGIGYGSILRINAFIEKFKTEDFVIVEDGKSFEADVIIHDKFINMETFQKNLGKPQYLISHPALIKDLKKKKLFLKYLKILVPFPKTKELEDIFKGYSVEFIGLLARKPKKKRSQGEA
jgi:hypothetical protein